MANFTVTLLNTERLCIVVIQVFKQIISDCLRKLDALGYESISFGTLGCGRLMYPVYEVADMMLDAIINFDFIRTRSKNVEVRIVIYDKDESEYIEAS